MRIHRFPRDTRALSRLVERDERARDPAVERAAARIVADVRRRGDAAVRECERRFALALFDRPTSGVISGRNDRFGDGPRSRERLAPRAGRLDAARRDAAGAAFGPRTRAGTSTRVAERQRAARRSPSRSGPGVTDRAARAAARPRRLLRARRPLSAAVDAADDGRPRARRRRRARSSSCCPRPAPGGAVRRASRPASTRVLPIGGAQAIAALAYGTAIDRARRQDRRPRQRLGRRRQGAGLARLRHRLPRRPERDRRLRRSRARRLDRRRPDRAGRARSGRARDLRDDEADAGRAAVRAQLSRAQVPADRRRPRTAAARATAPSSSRARRREAIGHRQSPRAGAPRLRPRRRRRAASRAAGTIFVGRWSAQAAGDYAHRLESRAADRRRGALSRRPQRRGLRPRRSPCRR